MKRSLHTISILKVMIALISFILTACGTGENEGSGSIIFTLNGTWKGTATSDNGGTFDLTLVLSQTDSNVSGTIGCTPRGTIACADNNGTMSGTINEDALSMRVRWNDGDTCDSFDGTLQGSTLKGTYSCTEFGGVQKFTVNGSWTATLLHP